MADIKSLIDKFNIFRTKDSILNDVAKDNGQITIDIKQPFSDDIDSNNSLKTKLETNIKDKLFNTEINNVGSNIFDEKIKPFDKGYNVSNTTDTDTKTPIDTTPIKPDTPTIEKNTADATAIQQEKTQQHEIITQEPEPEATQQYKTIIIQKKPKLTTDSLGNYMPIDYDEKKGKSYSGVGEQQIDEMFNILDTPEKFDMFMQSVSEAYNKLKSTPLNDEVNILFLPFSYDQENGNMNGARLTFRRDKKEWALNQLKTLAKGINDKKNEEWLSNLELPQPETTMDKITSNPWGKLLSFATFEETPGMDPVNKSMMEEGQQKNRLNAIKWRLIDKINECKEVFDKYYGDKSQVGTALSQGNIAETVYNILLPKMKLAEDAEIALILKKSKENPKGLTPIENEIVNYSKMLFRALSVIDSKTTTGYKTTKSILNSLPFMADFFRANFVGGAIRGGTRTAMKLGGKSAAKEFAKDVSKNIVSRAGKFAGDIGKSAVQTTLSPLTPQNMLEDYSQTIATDGQYTKNDLIRGGIEAFTENFSERMFGALKGILPKSNNAFVNSLFGNNPVIKSMQKHMNVGGMLEETAEEYAGAFLNTMFGFALGDEKLSSSFKEQLDNSATTILSIGITVGLPQAFGMGIDFREIKKMNNRFNVAENNLKQYFNKENSYLDINSYSDALKSLYINLNNAKYEEDKAEIKGKIAELNKTAANLAMEKGDSNGFNLISEYSIAAQNSFYVTNKAMSELKNMSEEDRTKLSDNAINKLKNDFTNNLNWSLISRAAAKNITDQNGKQHPTCFLYTDNGVTYVLNGQKDNMFSFVDVNGNTISKSADELRNNENLSVLHLNNLLSSFSNKELEDINLKFIDIAQYNAGYRYKVNDNGEIRYYTDNKDLIKSNTPYEEINKDKIESDLVGSYDLVRIDNITNAVEDMAKAFAEPAAEQTAEQTSDEQTAAEQTATEQTSAEQQPAQETIEQPAEELQEQPQEQTTQEPAQKQTIQEQTTEEQETTEQEPIQPAQQVEPAQQEQPAQEEDDSTALNGVPDIVDDTPQDARERGFRRVNGYKIDRQKPLQAVNGKEIAVRFSNDVIANGHVAVIDAEQLQPSHIQGVRNPLHFIDEAQPKERNDEASIVSAQRIAKNIRPEEITSSVTAYTGAPIINTRGETIQGNNRSDALRLMWSQNKDQAEKYKQYLIDHAQEFGLNAEDIAAMERPILVNMIDVSDEDAIALGQYVAQDTESGGLERIKPKNAVQKMGADMRTFANLLLSSNDDEISFAGLIDKNGVDVLNWLGQKGYITPTQYKSAFDTKGYITAEAKNDLRGIMYQSIFQGGSTRLEEMFNTMPAKAQKAILATAFRDYDSPKSESMIVEIQNSIRAYYALSQSADFMNAKTYKDVRLAVEGWKKQYQIDDATGESYLPAENFSNFALLLATMYKGEKQTLIQGTFNKLYDLIQGTQEADLFETPDNTPRTLSQAIKEVLNIDYNGQQRNNVLVGDTATSQRGEQGSTRDAATRERTEDGERTADSAGSIEAENRIAQNEQANTKSQGKKPNIRRLGREIGSSLSTDDFISETMSIVVKDVKTFPKEIREEDIISKEQKSGKERAGIKVKVGLLGNDLYIQYREGRSFANKNKELWEKVKRQYWGTIKIPNATNYNAGQLRYRLDYAGTTTDIARIVSDAVFELFHKKELRLHKGSEIGNVSIQEAALRDALIDKLREAGIDVITDVEEAQRVLDEANGNDIRQQKVKSYDPRHSISPVRGEWTKGKIIKRLKDLVGSRTGYSFAAKRIAEFDSADELAEHMFYHGTQFGGGRLKPSILMSDRDIERIGGGGYGEKYWGISVSSSKRIASNFSQGRSVSIYPIILVKNAKVKEMPELTDAADLEDYIEELWKEGVDAVWIGDKNSGEQELCVLNPHAIVNINSADIYKYFNLGTSENPLHIIDANGIEKLYQDAKRYVNALENKPQKPLKPSWFFIENDGKIGEMKSDEQYQQEMSEYEKKLDKYNNSDEVKRFEQEDDYARRNIRFFRTADGNAYGFTVGGKIYIDPRIATADTPIHEYAHLWASAMQKLNPKEWANIVKLMKGTPIWEEVKRNYPELTTDNEIADEVLAFYSGSRGAERLREEHANILKGNGNVIEKVKAINAIKRVREALKRFWKNVADWFGIHFTTAEEVADKVLSDLLNGVNPTLAGIEDDIRFEENSEEAEIVARAKADGTYMKAPNGKQSNLSPRQWVQVRTKAFKDWFGDWESAVKLVDENIRFKDIIGKTIIGYRYGKAPVSGRSFNTLTQSYESGVSMASVGYNTEVGSFAKTKNEEEGKFYYIGTIAEDTGGDDEICLNNVRELTKKEYELLLPQYTAISNAVANAYYNRSTNVASKGYDIDLERAKIKRDAAIREIDCSKVVDENGEPMVMWHETGKEFSIFDTRQFGAGSSDYITPFGIFLKYSPNPIGVARGGNEKQMALYVNMHNPIEFANREEMEDYLRSNCVGYAQAADRIKNIDAEYGKKIEAAEKAEDDAMIDIYSNNPDVWNDDEKRIEAVEKYSSEVDSILKEWKDTEGRLAAELKETTDQFFRSIGHDGVVLKIDEGSFGRKTKTIIAFLPNQVKSATDNVGTFDQNNPDIRYRKASNRSVISSRFERQAEIQREEKNTKSAANIVLGNANVVLNDTNIFDEQYQNAIDNNLIDENVSPLIDSFGITWGYQLKNGVIVINKDVFVSDILDKRVKDNLSLLISSLMKTNKTFFKEGISFFKKLPIWVLYKNDTKSNEDTIKEIINDILLGNNSIDTNKLELLKQYTVQDMNDILDNATKWFEKFEGISSNMFAGNSISDILDTTLGDLMPKEITTTQEGKRLNWFSKLGIDIRSKLFDSLDWFRVVSDKTKDKTASELYDAMIVHTKRVQGKIDIFDKEYVRPIIDTIQSMLGKDFGNSTLSLDLIQEYFAIKSLLGRTASLYKEKFGEYLANTDGKKPQMFDEFKQIYDEITEDEIRQRINEMGEKSSMSILQKVDIDYLMEEVRRTLAAEMFVKQYVYSSANTLNQGLQGEQSLGLINEVTNEPYSELYQLLYSDEQSSQTMHSPIEIIEQADILIDRAGLRKEFDFIGNQIQAILNYVNIERVENGLMSSDTFAKRQLMKDFVNQRGENSSEGNLYEITAKQKANEKMKGKDWFNPNSITSIIAVAQTEIATMEKELLAQRLSYFLTNPNNFDVLSQYGMIIDEKETLNEELSEDERNYITDKNIVLLYGERHTDKDTKGQVDKKKINILKRNDDGTFTKVTISFDNKFIGLEEFVKFVNNNFKYEELRGISKAAAPITAWFSRMYTILSPLFPTKNFFKDLMVTPWLPAKELNGKNSQYAIKNFYNAFNNLSFILKMSFTEKSFSKKGFENKLKARSQELFEYYLEYSKQHSIFSIEDQIGALSKENKTLQDIERALSSKENKFIKFTERALLIKFMQHYAELFENLHKFSAYVTLRKLGYGEERSAQIANNATLNYDRSGSIGRQLNAIIPFAKAALGGLYRTNYLLPKYNPKGFLQRVITLSVLGVMQGLMYDPDDDDISEFARKSGMVFGSFLYPLLPEELSIVRPVRALVIVMAGKKSPAYFKQELMESTIDLVPIASDALRGAFSYNPLTNKTEFDVGQILANTDKMTAVYALAMLALYINENKNSFGKNVLLNEETNTDKTRYGRTKQDYGLYDYLARLYNSILNGVDIDDRAAMSNKIGKNGERLMTIAKEDVEFVINNYIPFGRLYAYTAEIIYDAVNDKRINKGHIPLIGGLFAQKSFGKDYYLVNNIKYELKDFTNDFSQSQIEDIKTNILDKAGIREGIRYKALKDSPNANQRMLDIAKRNMNDAFNVFILDINNLEKTDFTEDEQKFMLKSFLDSPIMKKALSIGEDTLNKHTAKRIKSKYDRYKKHNNENIDTDKENMKDAVKNYKKELYDKSIIDEEFNNKLNSLWEPMTEQIKLRAKFAGYSIE